MRRPKKKVGGSIGQSRGGAGPGPKVLLEALCVPNRHEEKFTEKGGTLWTMLSRQGIQIRTKKKEGGNDFQGCSASCGQGWKNGLLGGGQVLRCVK